MFPIAFSSGSLNRTPRADDIAGISDIYGNETFRNSTGSISGRVTKNGAGVMGAHVVAFNPATGKLVAGFTLSADGAFVIAGLDPGPQVAPRRAAGRCGPVELSRHVVHRGHGFQGRDPQPPGHGAARRHGAQRRVEGRAQVSVLLPRIVFVLALPAAASAQPYVGSDTPHRGTVELGGGVVWTRGYDAGSAIARRRVRAATCR